VGEFYDAAVSGADAIDARPGFKELFRYHETGVNEASACASHLTVCSK
jgi:hypothetical protein